MTQAVVVDEMVPKHVVIRDQVVAQRVRTEGGPDVVRGLVVVNLSTSDGLRSKTLVSRQQASSYLPNRKGSTQGTSGSNVK